jgi:tRNA A-37 threonylcarbamoyl transferase component Bud32
MVVLLARHHRAGICQTDLHLNNFVYSENELYSLDGAGVTTVEGEQGPEAAFENLALLIAQLAPEWEASVPELYSLYRQQMGWREGPGADGLRRQVRRARARR